MAWQVPLSIITSALGMVNPIGDIFSMFNKPKDVTNYKKAYTYNKKLAKYQNSANTSAQLKLLAKQDAYNQKYLSNSSKATEALNKNLMDYQYALERQSRQSSYQDTRKDLESAGYNPLLAVGQQSGYVGVGSGVSTQSEGLENSQLANSATDIANKFNEMRNANKLVGQGQQKIDIDKLSSLYSNDLNSAKAEHERSMTRGQDISNGIQNITGLTEALQKLDLNEATKESIYKTIEYTGAQIENLAEQNKVFSAQSAKLAEDTKYVGYNAQTNRINANASYNTSKANMHNAWKTTGRTKSRGKNINFHAGPFGFGTGENWSDSW